MERFILSYWPSPVGTIYWVCRACSKSNGCGEQYPQSRESRNDRNLIAESKGVPGDRESEGSCRQTFVVTNRNRIEGLFFWVTEPWIRDPDSHSEEEGVNPARQMERITTYPGRSLRVPDDRIGCRVTGRRQA
jgi:hypothetical protein